MIFGRVAEIDLGDYFFPRNRSNMKRVAWVISFHLVSPIAQALGNALDQKHFAAMRVAKYHNISFAGFSQKETRPYPVSFFEGWFHAVAGDGEAHII